MSGQNYYRINPNINTQLLEAFELFRKVDLCGDNFFVTFHHGGDYLSAELPPEIYVHGKDLEILHRLIPNATIRIKTLPSGNIARLLITDYFESKILLNNSLRLSEKIELSIHCANEVAGDLQNAERPDQDSILAVSKVSKNLLAFTNLLLFDDETGRTLFQGLMSQYSFTSSHSVQVAFYSAFLAAELHRNRFIIIKPELLTNMFAAALIHDMGRLSDYPGQTVQRINAPSIMGPKAESASILEDKINEDDTLQNESLEIAKQLNERSDYQDEFFYLSYPHISPYVRIAIIADAFDTLTANRPGDKHYAPVEALIQMKADNGGRYYDNYIEFFLMALGNLSQLEAAG